MKLKNREHARRIKTTVIVDKSLWKKLRKRAIDMDMTTSGLVERMIKEYLSSGKVTKHIKGMRKEKRAKIYK